MSFARFVYGVLSLAALPYALWRLAKRGSRARKNKDEFVNWREYFGFCPRPPQNNKPLIWVHAVSVGEATAAAGLVRRLREKHRLILTHTTASGGAVWRRHCPGDDVVVAACPLDIPFAAKIFFRRCRPALGVVMEAEYWPNLINAAQNAGCKLMLANARLGKKGARRYAKVAPLMRECARAFDIIGAQHKNDARRLRFFGAREVFVSGNLKFDRDLDRQLTAQGKNLREQTPNQNRPVLLIAGSRAGEEELLITALERVNARDSLSIIWAPRHPRRADALAAMLNNRNIDFARRSAGGGIGKQPFYIADTLGEMDLFYACCDIAIICGSFAPFGGQNPIEAMQHGIAAVIGPFAENYRQLVREANKAGALHQAQNADDAAAIALSIAKDKNKKQKTSAAALNFHNQNRGATTRTLQAIDELLT